MCMCVCWFMLTLVDRLPVRVCFLLTSVRLAFCKQIFNFSLSIHTQQTRTIHTHTHRRVCTCKYTRIHVYAAYMHVLVVCICGICTRPVVVLLLSLYCRLCASISASSSALSSLRAPVSACTPVSAPLYPCFFSYLYPCRYRCPSITLCFCLTDRPN